jgi:L-gulonolactone oxidase
VLIHRVWHLQVQNRPYGFNVPYRKFFRSFEAIVSRYHGRPHWAKAHQLRPEALRKLYPRFNDFVQVLEAVDPNGMFRNEYVRRHIFGMTGHQVDDRLFKPANK